MILSLKFHSKKWTTWILIFAFAAIKLQAEDVESPPISKKKILILCSNGGNGHNAAASALKTILHDKYDFSIVYPINELEIFGIPSGESLYNLALRKGWTRSVNVVSRYVAPKIFRGYKKKLESLIAKHIEAEAPDLVISVIPFINLSASEAARKAGIPYLMITT